MQQFHTVNGMKVTAKGSADSILARHKPENIERLLMAKELPHKQRFEVHGPKKGEH